MEIPVNLVVEDTLGEYLLREILCQSKNRFLIGACYGKGGIGYIQKKIRGFNNASRGMPYFVLVDLDRKKCAPSLIKEWFERSKIHHNLQFRIAVKEAESWLMADRETFADFLGIKKDLIPEDLDKVDDPKRFLINLAKKSLDSEVKHSIIPNEKSTSKIGPNYNGLLGSFIVKHWKVSRAVVHSESLRRTFNRINKFKAKTT